MRDIDDLKRWLASFLRCGRSRVDAGPHESNAKDISEQTPISTVPLDDAFPVFPPSSPETLIRDQARSWKIIEARKYAAPRGVTRDSSLFALYRLYEYIVLDKVFAYRNMLEWLWRQSHWSICDIPDPDDDDPARYAFLAAVTYLIVRSFNARVKMGLAREGKAIMTDEEVEECRNRPDSERKYESIPAWAETVAPLPDLLTIPTHDGVTLDGKNDKRADPDFLTKNILLWTPHISFT